jgi:hypothetical protein
MCLLTIFTRCYSEIGIHFESAMGDSHYSFRSKYLKLYFAYLFTTYAVGWTVYSL